MKRLLYICAVGAVSVAVCSCQGRRADGTPNGETVEVVLEPTVSPTDTASVSADTMTVVADIPTETETAPEPAPEPDPS